MIKAILFYMGVVAVALNLSACGSSQSVSSYARTGDTVLVSLGGSESHALVSVLKKENITVTITDSLLNTYPVKIRRLFRTYSDPTSGFNIRSANNQLFLGGFSGAPQEIWYDPYQSQWMAVIDLVDPVTEVLPPLAEGVAAINISSPDLNNPSLILGVAWTRSDYSNIAVEILSGTGARNALNSPVDVATVHPMSYLEPLTQLEIVPLGVPASSDVGGAHFTFSFVTSDFVVGRPRIVATSPDPNVQLMVSYKPNTIDGTTMLTAIVTNPNGFRVANDHSSLADGGSDYKSLKLSVVWDNGPEWTDNTATEVTDNWAASLQLVSASYVDLDGNLMAELIPEITRVN